MIRQLLTIGLTLSLIGCAAPPGIQPTAHALTGNYYIAGHVERPGAYSLKVERISLRQALIDAGYDPNPAIPSHVHLLRRRGVNAEDAYDINAVTIFKSSLGDTPVQPDDEIIFGVNAMTNCWPSATKRIVRIP